jgi:diguanylate cyclase (GGDEF)-like protein
MKFPLLEELATTDVIYIDIEATIKEAITLMLSNEHRNIIVQDGNRYRILMISKVVCIKKKSINQTLKLKTLHLPQIIALHKKTNILKCVTYINANVDYICTLNDNGSLHGILTLTDIISYIDPDTLIENYTLREYLYLGTTIMQSKPNEIVLDLFDKFEQSNFDSVVITEKEHPVGILTAKDILKALKKSIDLNVPAKVLMSSPIETLHADATVKNALEFIRTKSFKRVIVIDSKGALAGAITQKELISLTYTRWAQLIKEHYNELQEINKILKIENDAYKLKASQDYLTKLYNRHYFNELFETRYEYLEVENSSDTLLLIDVDDFKKINDTFGHNEGDKVLVAIAQTIQRSLRGNDIVARWGGEEFVVLLPTTDVERAFQIAQKIQKRVKTLSIGNSYHRVTISIGMTLCKQNEKLEQTLTRADQALYHAKDSGKDCIKILTD